MAAATITLPFERRLSPADRLLSCFSDVRPGEGLVVLLMTANLFLLLASYYILKVVREALILSENGAVVKSYAAGGQALLLLLIVPAYGLFASRVRRSTLLNGVTLFFVSHMVIFYALGATGVRVGVP